MVQTKEQQLLVEEARRADGNTFKAILESVYAPLKLEAEKSG